MISVAHICCQCDLLLWLAASYSVLSLLWAGTRAASTLLMSVVALVSSYGLNAGPMHDVVEQ